MGMSWSRFDTQVPGKWVLAGEHSVLRGATAVALPHPEFGLTLSFDPAGDSSELKVEPESATSLIQELFQAVKEAWEAEGMSFYNPVGKLKIESTIPMGAGLGSSAALCVAMTQWMAEPLSIPKADQAEFATQLEHRFHGKSSGMDIAVIFAGEPISFVKGGKVRSLGVKKLPRFTFHDTQLRSRTSDCVLQVENFRVEAPTLAMQVDEAMGMASRMAMEGLIQFDAGRKKEGLELVQRSMLISRDCFYSWELVPSETKQLEEEILAQGALAVKLTGAGGGGMLVALWED
jgi:mevalonate kinase